MLQLRARRLLPSFSTTNTATGTADNGSVLESKKQLQNWHAAVAKVPLSSILPPGFGGTSECANIAAFFGDKRIGFQVALAARERISAGTGEMSLGALTDLQSEATSNQMLASRLADILPLHVTPDMSQWAAKQIHDAGTMVEAAVEAVHADKDVAAISELARFLGGGAEKGVLYQRQGPFPSAGWGHDIIGAASGS